MPSRLAMPDSTSPPSSSTEDGPRARVRFWGTRGTCASPGPRTVRYGGNTPCVEVRANGGPTLVLDAGTGIRALGQHLQSRLKATPVPDMPAPNPGPHDQAIHLFLTHRHADHVMGLPHFAPLHTRSRSVHVRCGDGDCPSLTQFVSSLVSPPLFPYVDGLAGQLLVHEWPTGDVSVGTFRVHRFNANHPGGAAIIRIDDANGPIVAYAPDNELALHSTQTEHLEWLAGLRHFLNGVPLLVHDAMYRQDELAHHAGWGHSSDMEAVQLAVDCGVQTLALFHHHPDRDDDAIERIVDEARHHLLEQKSSLRTLAAWEGLTLSV